MVPEEGQGAAEERERQRCPEDQAAAMLMQPAGFEQLRAGARRDDSETRHDEQPEQDVEVAGGKTEQAGDERLDGKQGTGERTPRRSVHRTPVATAGAGDGRDGEPDATGGEAATAGRTMV